MKLTAERSLFSLKTPFRISRGVQTQVEVVTVTLSDGRCSGRGESVGVDYRGESIDTLLAQIAAVAADVESGLRREELLLGMAPGGARNAIDCALWDFEAKRSGVPAWRLAGVAPPAPQPMTVTLGLDTPARMADAARRARPCSALKLKLGHGDDDVACVAAVHAAAPHAVLLCDVNEAWTFDQLRRYMPELEAHGLRLIEQPLRAGEDAELCDYESPIPLCADESCFDTNDLQVVRDRYDAINIKLEKTGGLTEALRLADAATALHLQVMVGCMVSTSLSIAPALLLGAPDRWLDLDGQTYLTSDRAHPVLIDAGLAQPAVPELWG